MSLMTQLKQGGVLRFRPPHGFYVVMHGKHQPVRVEEAEQAIKARRVRPLEMDQFGVYHFTLAAKEAA